MNNKFMLPQSRIGIFIMLLFLLSCFGVNAQSFSSRNSEGKKIYYEVVSENPKEVQVVRKLSKEYTGTVVIPAEVSYKGVSYSVTSIGSHAFFDMPKLESVSIPNSVTSIGNSAFGACYNLTGVKIPNSVDSIASEAFFHCNDVEVLNNNVSFIGSDAFAGVKNVIINSQLDNNAFPWKICTVNGYVEGNLVYADSSKTILTGCYRSAKKVSIPYGVKIIADNAFYLCQQLKSLEIPNSVTAIGHFAFGECSNLTSVSIPGSVREIGYGAFGNCESLRTIVIPYGVSTIWELTFFGCYRLKSILLPSSVRTVEVFAFAGCEKLKTVVIGNESVQIGKNAFAGCWALKSVKIGHFMVAKTELEEGWCLINEEVYEYGDE